MISLVARLIPLTALVLLVAVAGCSTEDNPATAEAMWKVPGIGSSYSFIGYQSADSTGNPRPDSGQPGVMSDINTVIAIGRSYKGVSNLVAMSEGGGTLLLDYRTNGDLAFVGESANPAEMDWVVLPIGSRGTLTRTSNENPFITGSGDTIYISVIRRTATYAGSETVTIGGVSLLVHKVDLVTAGNHYGPHPTSDTARVRYFVAPSIGFFTGLRRTPQAQSPAAPYFHLALTAYTLK